MTARHRDRWRQLMRCLPEVRNYKTMLYVGAKVKKTFPSGMQLTPGFVALGYTMDVLEIWGPNVKDILRFNKRKKYFRTVIKGDVRKIDKYINGADYDVVAWWHGPEHIPLEDIPATLKKLEALAKHLVVVAMPYGGHTQGPSRDNPFERHECTLTPEYFEQTIGDGWQADAIGTKGEPPNNLMAWKRTQ